MPPRNVALAVAIAKDGRPKYAIAAAAGVHPSNLSAYIAGSAAPAPETRQRLAHALAATEDDLFGEQAANRAAAG